MVYVERQFRSLFFALLACFATFGVCITIVGATLPKIFADFGWSDLEAGGVLAAGAFGYFISALVSGILIHRIGAKRVVVTGLALQALGLAFFAASRGVPANGLLLFLIGVGQGGLEVVINYSIVRMERGGRSRLMNLMHAAFCIGAIAGPFGVVALLSMWQAVYRLMAAVALALGIVLAFLPFSRLEDEDDGAAAHPPVASLLRRPLLVLSFLILLIYVATELGVSSWVGEYFVRVLGQEIPVGAAMVSVFWAGLFLGRLALSVWYHGSRPAGLIVTLAVMCTLGLAFAIAAQTPWLAAAGFFVAGLGYSAIYPLVIVLVGAHFPGSQGVAVGLVSAGGGVGSFAGQVMMGAASQRLGLRGGFLLYIAANVLMVGLAAAVAWRVRASEKASGR